MERISELTQNSIRAGFHLPFFVQLLSAYWTVDKKLTMPFSPKTKRNLYRIVPFGLIWWLCGWVIVITEMGVTRNQNLNPETDISFTLPVLIFANIANVLVGCLVGAMEVIYLEKRFTNNTIQAKFIYKFSIYLSLFIVIIVAFYPLAFTLETNLGFFSVEAWDKLGRFLLSISFLTTLFQLAVPLFLCLAYSAVSENLGHQVVLNLFTGKYHRPKKEQRIFMFLDMKDSTTIAEQLGHDRYFSLLQAYYQLMSDPIIINLGEVYQYIGDEVVITWPAEKGLSNAHCLRCFEQIKTELHQQADSFQSKFGTAPDCKAGLHLGEVTTGVIGALKKEIVYTGDVLNTAARIQGLCKAYQTDLIVSESIMNAISSSPYPFKHLGEVALKGKSQLVGLYGLKAK